MGVEIIPVRKSEKLTGGLGGARWGGERGGVALSFTFKSLLCAIWIQAHEINKGFVFVGFDFHFS